MLDRWPHFSLTEEFIINNCKEPRSFGCQRSPNHLSSTAVLNSWYEVLMLICSVCLLFAFVFKCGAAIWPKISIGLDCSKDIFLEVLCLVQMQFCNLMLRLILERRNFFLANLVMPNKQSNQTCSVFLLYCHECN